MPGLIAAVITHLPNRKGYHAQRFEVIQECFRSLRENAGVELPLYVWDNGSDASFRNWLTKSLRPDYLTLAPNVGKGCARTAMIRAFPSETVVCFSDEDIYFYPGWLDAQLELLRGFPNAGAVSGCPIRTQFRWGTKNTLKWAGENAVLKTGRFIPDEWERDFCVSIERDWTAHCQSTAGDLDYVIEYNGMKAYATAHHMQFICLAGKLGVIGSWSGTAMRDDQTFDVAIDLLGLLRLTTVERYTRHLGNILEPMEQSYAGLRLPLP